MKQYKYHYIYKTTCLVTSRYYIGMHSTDNLDDGYLGSGKFLIRSIKKFGKEKHIKEILEYAKSRDELKTREKEIVTNEVIKEELCMNLKLGGEGGWENVNPWPPSRSRTLSAEHIEKIRINSSNHRHTDETRKKISNSNIGKHNIIHTEETKNKIRDGNLKMAGENNGFFGKTHSKETKLKWSLARKGKIKVNNGIKTKIISKSELTEYLNKKWIKGGLTKPKLRD